MEPPDPSFADEFNYPVEYAVLIFDVRRAAVSLPFQVHRLKVLVEAGQVAFSGIYLYDIRLICVCALLIPVCVLYAISLLLSHFWPAPRVTW